jgi:electron transfer flavoprotein beta subunit
MDRTSMPTIINPDDLNAVEAALCMKEDIGAKVVVVTMGPPQAAIMLHELLAMGADEAVLISGREFSGSDTFATSQILAASLRRIGLEDDTVILCGRQAIDGDTAQVGPQIAEKLNIPQVSYVQEVKHEGNALICKRMLEDGYMTIRLQPPCLMTCIKELNTPRYMTVRGIMEFDKKSFAIFDYETLEDDELIEKDSIGLKGSPTNVFKAFSPPPKGAGMMIPGTGKEAVEQLFGILAQKHLV